MLVAARQGGNLPPALQRENAAQMPVAIILLQATVSSVLPVGYLTDASGVLVGVRGPQVLRTDALAGSARSGLPLLAGSYRRHMSTPPEVLG